MPTLRERLVGSWRLISYEVRDTDGELVGYPLGEGATGSLIYTADGLMSVQVMRPDRPLYQAGGIGDARGAALRDHCPSDANGGRGH